MYKINYLITFLCMLVLLSGCSSEPGSKGLIEVSHAQLLVNAKQYDGYTVIVNGYAKSNGGFINLYQNKEDFMTGNQFASVWVDDTPEKISAIEKSPCINQYVSVTGPFGVIKSLKFRGIIQVDKIRYLNIHENDSEKNVNCY